VQASFDQVLQGQKNYSQRSGPENWLKITGEKKHEGRRDDEHEANEKRLLDRTWSHDQIMPKPVRSQAARV